MERTMQYDPASETLTPQQQDDLAHRQAEVAKALPSLARLGPAAIQGWIIHCNKMLWNEDYRATLRASHATGHTEARQKRGRGIWQGPPPPKSNRSFLDGYLRSEWPIGKPRITEPNNFKQAMQSLRSPKLCGEYGFQEPPEHYERKYRQPDKKDRRQTALSHKILMFPQSEKIATPTMRAFARSAIKIGLEYHVPLIPEYFGQTVSLTHLVLGDDLTKLQWDCVEMIGGKAADLHEIKCETKPMGHFHLEKQARVTRSSKYLPSEEMTLEEMHPELMARLDATR